MTPLAQPRWLLDWAIMRAYWNDFRRYRRHSSVGKHQNKGQHNIAALILKEVHALEKGFSLPDIRAGYGSQKIPEIIALMSRYRNRGYDCHILAYKKAQSVFAEYLRYHEAIGHDLGSLGETMRPWADSDCDIGGYKALSRDELQRGAHGDFRECAMSRASIRQYATNPVPLTDIKDAIRIAQKSPSVCNRQDWRVRIVRDSEKKRRVLELQNGNRGFGAQADFVAVITSDLRGFAGPGERNEAFVDGGLFAMSLLLAFHYKGIGACPLNWMVEPATDRKLREVLAIGPSENIIMIIAAGALPETVRIAKSARKPLEDVFVLVEEDVAGGMADQKTGSAAQHLPGTKP
jgi:nitroreductase